MLKAANSVCLIDHHKTAIEDLQPLFMQDSWTGEPKQLAHFTDLNRSGATLAWDYLFPGEDRPLLLGHGRRSRVWPARHRRRRGRVRGGEDVWRRWPRQGGRLQGAARACPGGGVRLGHNALAQGRGDYPRPA